MRKFYFRLAPLLRLQEATRDECRAQLAEAFRAEQVLRERMEELKQDLANLKQDARRAGMAGAVDIDRLIDAQRYEFILLAQQESLKQHGQTLAEEIERRRQALVSADREVKILEKLRSTQRAEHQQEAARQEVKVLDEVAARTHEGEWQ